MEKVSQKKNREGRAAHKVVSGRCNGSRRTAGERSRSSREKMKKRGSRHKAKRKVLKPLCRNVLYQRNAAAAGILECPTAGSFRRKQRYSFYLGSIADRVCDMHGDSYGTCKEEGNMNPTVVGMILIVAIVGYAVFSVVYIMKLLFSSK